MDMGVNITGARKNYTAEVDDRFRLTTFSTTRTLSQEASDEGRAFNLNTGDITLTSASDSAVLYVANKSQRRIDITTIGFLLGNSTGGAGDLVLKTYKNPTQGTIVTNAVEVDIFQNKNSGSSRTFTPTDLNRYKGAEGDTITNGSLWYTSRITGTFFYTINTGNLILEPGGSLAVSITPQTGNTSMTCQVFLSLFEELESLVL